MKIEYKNRKLESWLIAVNTLTCGVVVASFVMLFGFARPVLSPVLLHIIQLAALCVFIVEKLVRMLNAVSKLEYLRWSWFEIPLVAALCGVLLSAGQLFARADPSDVRLLAVGVYLIVEVLVKVCKGGIGLAASGKSPARGLIASFLVLIITGTGLLTLPKSASLPRRIGFVDALFTATSATCVTGLIVKDTGGDFTYMGQLIILGLIQLGGLGIVVFGAVIALLLGRALSLRESATMQDLLSAQTLGRIGRIIAFIFITTVAIEAIGAVVCFGMWDDVPGRVGGTGEQWFFSIFHSISAFCNAGFCLFEDSLVGYDNNWAVYGVICPLIILGGLGFGVLYNVFGVTVERTKRLFKRLFTPAKAFSMQAPRRLQLQTKIVLTVSGLLIIVGAAGFLFFESAAGGPSDSAGQGGKAGVLAAVFQSVTARTAGFNTVDVGSLSASARFVLILLMFIGGSPASTAGGIKTVTFAVVIMAAYATLRKRSEVEMFRRSVHMVIVGKALTVTILFIAVLFGVTLALSVTERANGFTMSQIMFEAASALGTVGLSTGITPALTTAGKLFIIATMLIGRLGPLTLLASLTFDVKPAGYGYPEEAIVVG